MLLAVPDLGVQRAHAARQVEVRNLPAAEHRLAEASPGRVAAELTEIDARRKVDDHRARAGGAHVTDERANDLAIELESFGVDGRVVLRPAPVLRREEPVEKGR